MSSFDIGGSLWPGTSKVIEEAGELVQVLGKLIATGGSTDYWDGTDLGERMIEEVADLLAALEFFQYVNGLDRDRIIQRQERKFWMFHAWHREHTENEQE